jgi:pyruvate dehydrogenase (quinone)
MISDLAVVLRSAAIARVYGVAEDALAPLARAFSETVGVTWRELRTAEAAVHAAADQAEATGELAVCAGVYGVRQAGLILGLRSAHQRGAPVLALALHVSAEEESADVIREIHPERVFSGCSIFCAVVEDHSQLERLTRIGMQHALVRGGVAVVALESDVASDGHSRSERPRAGAG